MFIISSYHSCKHFNSVSLFTKWRNAFAISPARLFGEGGGKQSNHRAIVDILILHNKKKKKTAVNYKIMRDSCISAGKKCTVFPKTRGRKSTHHSTDDWFNTGSYRSPRSPIWSETSGGSDHILVPKGNRNTADTQSLFVKVKLQSSTGLHCYFKPCSAAKCWMKLMKA